MSAELLSSRYYNNTEVRWCYVLIGVCGWNGVVYTGNGMTGAKAALSEMKKLQLFTNKKGLL